MARWVLSDRAADWMRAQMNAGYTGEADPARQRARDGSLPLPLPVHFELTRKVVEGVAVWRVSAGAVQDGQKTVWFEGADVDLTGAGEEIVYASLSASESEGAGKSVTVGVVADASELAALQTDGGPTVWPLYHLTDGLIDMDYRPIFSVGGGSAPARTLPGPFEPVHDATTGFLTGFTNCIYCAERQFVACGVDGFLAISGVDGSTSGYVILTLPHNVYSSASDTAIIINASVSVAIESELPMNATGGVTKIPLYHVSAGVVDVDVRAVPTGVLAR